MKKREPRLSLEGFEKSGILVVFNAGAKLKPQHSLSIRGFQFCDKAEDGQNNGLAKPSITSKKASYTNDADLFKKLTEDIWEFRTLFQKTHYRLFAFWDKSRNTRTLVITTHGIIKKTDKTPKAELERAEKLRKQYLDLRK